ncbi:MAG: 2-C-methyl-D-erythritol 4-phosphate cytidylyltransferase [Bacteroidales bacterium]|nr:2-C-methyl-D-erythritol 4-phosphate cytidylyltransferase [Bacteroidales bacterium]
MKRAVIIVAGGKGVRMGMQTPKQFLPIAGVPILCRTIQQFKNFDPTIDIYLVLPTTHLAFWQKLSEAWIPPNQYNLVEGGSERFFSVKNAVDILPDEIDIVGVHDGVRPLVSVANIAECYTKAALLGNAVPCIAPPESVRIVDKEGMNNILDRNAVKLIQTPQVFHADILKQAYKQPYCEQFTDDASVVEKFGQKINLVNGDKNNIKITTFEDINFAEFLITKTKK